MPTVSVSVPETLRKEMAKLDEVNWSAVARKAFQKEVDDLKLLKRIVMRSKLTEKDAKEIADKVNKAVAERFRRR